MEGLSLKEPTTLVDSIESSIYKYIKDNHLQAGDKLPSEEELAESLGVGRNAVREALNRLKSFGIITSRKKRGMELQNINVSETFVKIFDPQVLDKDTYIDLLEIRMFLEMAFIPVLFKRVSDEDIRDLEDILSKEVKTIDGVIPVSDEQEFHARIISITGNKTLQDLYKSLLPLYRYVHDNVSEFDEYNRYLIDHHLKTSHRDLLEALRSRDEDKYRTGIKNHLLAYEKYIESYRASQ